MTVPNPRLEELPHADLVILAGQWLRQAMYWRQQSAELNQLLQARWNNEPTRERGRTITYKDPTGNKATGHADRKAS